MSLLSTTDDAERVAKSWMQRKYGSKLGKVKFVEVMGEGGIWTLKAKVMLSTGLLSFKPHLIQLRVDSGSTDVTGYAETEIDSKAD